MLLPVYTYRSRLLLIRKSVANWVLLLHEVVKRTKVSRRWTRVLADLVLLGVLGFKGHGGKHFETVFQVPQMHFVNIAK